DDHFESRIARPVHEQLAKIPAPAVVLFRFDSKTDSPHEEPVYNTDVAWPDDAPVIRAHDLGAPNVEIYRYYLDRDFYLYQVSSNKLIHLGKGHDLLAHTTSVPTGI